MPADIITSLIAAALVVAAVVAGTLALGGLLHWTRRRDGGYFTYVFGLALLTNALLIATSGRDLSASIDLRSMLPAQPNAVLEIIKKIVSILLVLASVERIAHRLTTKAQDRAGQGLMLAFIAFWVGTIALPAFLGLHRTISHEYIYSLLFGWAALCSTEADAEDALIKARNAMMAFVVASWVAAIVNPNFAMELRYAQGFIPGLPRFAGLAAHAITMAMVTHIGLLCLWARPLRSAGWNTTAWAVGITTLVLAQSKTTWISFILCSGVILYVQQGASAWNTISSRKHSAFAATALTAVMLFILAAGAVIIFGDVSERVDRFLATSEGAQLTSLTGRDQIWAATLQEWQQSPIFGYGLSMFDLNFRLHIGILNATHGHNQFMDTLGRSGVVGAISLVVYVALLFALSVRHAKRSGGLTLAIFLAIALRGISEVPLSLAGYGPEFLSHLLLLIVLMRYTRATKSSKGELQHWQAHSPLRNPEANQTLRTSP